MCPSVSSPWPIPPSDRSPTASTTGMSDVPIIRFEGVVKAFPGVAALSGVSFDIRAGSCHALCGENGAGKSTLGRILAGVFPHDGGRVLVNGAEVRFASPREALNAGIAMVHQELALCPNLTVAENLCLGQLPARGRFVRRPDVRAKAARMLDAVGASVDPGRVVGDLTIGQQQMVQVAASVGTGARVIVFDEPTSSLGQHEADQLYALLALLRSQGVTCIYVSHRLREIFRLCDTVTVLRDGHHVATQETGRLDESSLVQMMVGRVVEDRPSTRIPVDSAPEVLRVEHFSSPGRFENVSFGVRAGEVVGLAGLVGAGRSELAQALFGLDGSATGRVSIDGTPRVIDTPGTALKFGLGLVPEDRKHQGLVLSLGGVANTTLPFLDRLARATFVRQAAERGLVSEQFAALRVKIPHLDFPVAGLSGGNQQKIVLARWLAARCRILILDEPTRGVDVGAKAEIRALIDELSAKGTAIVLISSELPELLSLSSRILVLRRGRLAGEVPGAAATEEGLMRLMAGVEDRPEAS